MLLRRKLLEKKKFFDLRTLTKKLENKNACKNFFFFMLGTAISGIAVSVIYESYCIVASGSTGLALFINNYIDIDLSLIIFAISALLLVLGFISFGIEYGAKNILATIIVPVFVKASTLLNNIIVFEEVSLFLLAILAGVLSGVAFGLIKKSGYSSGGLCVLYDIISRKFKISVGKANLICNVIIISLGMFIFGVSECIYGFVALYVSSVVADRVMIGISSNKAFYIVTKKPLEVRDYIINNLKHSVTIINAKGGYSGKKKMMLLCVIPTIEYTRVKEIVKEIDKEVFFLITDSYYVSK